METSTRILAIRHGETAWNVDTRIQGHLDIPLNDTGRWQARRLARALAARDALHAVYSSDLQRAHETAQAIAAATGAPLRTHAGLRERGFGLFEGRTYAEIEQTWPEESEHWRRRTPDWCPPQGGESLIEVRARILQTLQELAAPHAGQQIVLVAHGGVMDQLYRLATGQDLQAPRTWQLGNTAVNRLLWTPEGLSLVGWADTSHLEDNALDEFST
ncbi:MAG: histidine phosphatase family protein [Curvibacter sp.]